MLGFVGAIALAARIAGIGGPSLWFDEALEVQRALAPLPNLISGHGIDQDPPLFAAFLRAWLVAGDAEAWLRLPSALFGAAATVVVAGWVWQACGRRDGALAGAFAAVAPVLILYGQEVNQYALAVFLTMWLLVSFDRVWRRGRGRDWAEYAIVSILALCTHYGLGLPIAALGLALVARARRPGGTSRRCLLAYSGALAVVLVALWSTGLSRSLAMPHLQRRLGGTDLAKEWRYISDVGWREVVVFYLLPYSGGPALGLVRVMAVVALGGAVAMVRRGGLARQAVGLIFVGGLGLSYLASLMGWYPLGYRYGLFAAPVLLVALGHGIATLSRHGGPWGAAAGACVAGGALASFMAFAPQLDAGNRWLAVPREALRPVLEYVAEHRAPTDAVYVYYGAAPAFAYYERRLGVTPAAHGGFVTPTIHGGFFTPATAGAEAARIRAAGAGHARVWVVMSHLAPGDREALLARALVGEAGRPALYVVDHAAAENAAVYALEAGPSAVP